MESEMERIKDGMWYGTMVGGDEKREGRKENE